MPNTLRYCRLTGLTNGAALRTATFDGAEHLIAPVTMLVGDCVIEPMGSSGPEYVPADILQLGVGSWAGRPVVPDHPSSPEGPISANDPAVLQTFSFGRVFNPRFENGALKAEVWLDPARAARVSDDAVRVIERVRAKENVEVSIGAWTVLEQVSGTHNDKPYEYAWSTCVIPDHLALLPEGVPGACDASMGCGVFNTNKSKEAAMPDAQLKPLSPLQRVLQAAASALGIRTAAGDTTSTSDHELRNLLWDALHSTVPAFQYVVDVYQDTSTVVYAASPDNNYSFFSRTFSHADSKVTLNDDASEVISKTIWQTVTKPGSAAEGDTATLRAACGCQDKGSDGNSAAHADASTEAAADEAEKGKSTMDTVTAALVGRIIQAQNSPYDESHRETLAALGQTKLTRLADALAPVATPPAETPPVVEEPTPTPTPVTEEQLPPEMQQLLRRARAIDAAERAQSMKALEGAVKSGIFTAEQLSKKSTDELAQLARLSGASAPAVDMTLRGVPAPDTVDDVPPAPDIYDMVNLQKSYRERQMARR